MRSSPEGTSTEDSIEHGSMRSCIRLLGSGKFKHGLLKEKQNEVWTFTSIDQLVS